MKKTAAAFAIALALCSPAFAASTINPAVPAQGAPLSSAPIRQNFQNASNDINAIQAAAANAVTAAGALTAHGFVVGGGGKASSAITPCTSGQVLQSAGSGADPTCASVAIATSGGAQSLTYTDHSGAGLTITGYAGGNGWRQLAGMACFDLWIQAFPTTGNTTTASWNIVGLPFGGGLRQMLPVWLAVSGHAGTGMMMLDGAVITEVIGVDGAVLRNVDLSGTQLLGGGCYFQ